MNSNRIVAIRAWLGVSLGCSAFLDCGASAQAPSVEARVLLAQGAGGAGPRLPAPYSFFNMAVMFDHNHVLAQTPQGPVFLSDGTTVRRVMTDGAAVPGAPDGVVWRSSFLADVWPLAAGGAAFTALLSGGSLGEDPVQVSVAGVFESPVYVADAASRTFTVTPNGLHAALTQSGASVGPLGGPLNVVVPVGYIPPGADERGAFNGGQGWFLNSDGALALPYVGLLYSVCLVADAGSIRVAASDRVWVESDRGLFETGTHVSPASQPLPDGAVFINSPALSLRDARRSGLWLAERSGRATIVAVAGDPAPGTPAGVVFDPAAALTPLAANRAGSFLFLASLAGPGVDGANNSAVFLWRRGATTLIARSRPGLALDFSGPHAVAVNQHDDVGFCVGDAVLLFRPGVGTVPVAQRGAPLPPSAGIPGNATRIAPLLGASSTVQRRSGGDDASISHLSDAGRFFFVCSTAAGGYVLNARITDPGCPADFNADGFIDFFDYADFVECFEGGRCPDGRSGDFNHDDFADFFDYLDFVRAFEEGC